MLGLVIGCIVARWLCCMAMALVFPLALVVRNFRCMYNLRGHPKRLALLIDNTRRIEKKAFKNFKEFANFYGVSATDTATSAVAATGGQHGSATAYAPRGGGVGGGGGGGYGGCGGGGGGGGAGGGGGGLAAARRRGKKRTHGESEFESDEDEG